MVSSLYLPCDEPLVAALQESLTALGYTLYNPFGLTPGKAYAKTVRLFVAPAVDGWTRVIGEPDARQLPILSRTCLCLRAALTGKDAQIDVHVNGAQVEPQTALMPYLRAGCSADDLHQALHSPSLSLVERDSPSMLAVPLDILPDDVRVMAEQVNPQQAQKRFERLSGTLMGKVSRQSADEARRMLAGGDAPDWNSVGGQRIRALLACLTAPDHEPDFTTLRDAYQAHERRRRNPNARLYPGDAEAMENVPNALAYTPVYGGQ